MTVPELVLVGRAEGHPGPAQEPTWRLDAACRGMDTDLFFPARGESLAPLRAICARCPVREQCLDEHLMGTCGFWGGMSERERRAERRRREIKAERPPAPCGTLSGYRGVATA